MPKTPAKSTWNTAACGFVAALLGVAIFGVFFLAPTEETMGDAQRILYIHVACAWCGLLGFLAMAGCGLMYLRRRNLAWDDWAQSATELGWLCCGLTLLTGSLWARAAWNTWWTWDPRLTTTFILWAISSGALILRGSVEDPHHRARIGAVVAILGSVDLPLVVLATRWFRGMHPKAPQMEPSMRAVLLLTVAAFTALFALLLVRRRVQLGLERRIVSLEQQLGM